VFRSHVTVKETISNPIKSAKGVSVLTGTSHFSFCSQPCPIYRCDAGNIHVGGETHFSHSPPELNTTGSDQSQEKPTKQRRKGVVQLLIQTITCDLYVSAIPHSRPSCIVFLYLLINLASWAPVILMYSILCILVHRIPLQHSNQSYRGADKSLARQEGNKLQRQKVLMFIYPIYYHNMRNISTIYIHNKTSIKRNILTI